MDEFFVRVYTMKDGSKKEPNAIYTTYPQAVADLDKFNLSGVDVDDMQNVSYAQVEKRFSPTPIWLDSDCGWDDGSRVFSQ